jgi:hypothetical protein
MTPLEAVTAPCPKSPFKDDRHEWAEQAFNSWDYVWDRSKPYYRLAQCKRCELFQVQRLVRAPAMADRSVQDCVTTIHAFYDKP